MTQMLVPWCTIDKHLKDSYRTVEGKEVDNLGMQQQGKGGWREVGGAVASGLSDRVA